MGSIGTKAQILGHSCRAIIYEVTIKAQMRSYFGENVSQTQHHKMAILPWLAYHMCMTES